MGGVTPERQGSHACQPSLGSSVHSADTSSRGPLRPAYLSGSPHSCPSTASSAVLQGSLFGQLGTMPSTYSTLFLSGQGLAGIFAALAMLMSMASEWTWVAGGQDGLWDSGEQGECARSEVLWRWRWWGDGELGLGFGEKQGSQVL